MNLKKYSLGMLTLLIGLASCSDADLEPTLQQSKSIETSINTVNDLQAIINGAYERLSASAYYGRDKIILGEVFADNASSNSNSNRFVAEAQMDLLAQSGLPSSFWSQAYGVIASANIIIAAEGIEGDQDLINQLKGQAYALRALAHFDLLTYYGQQNVNGGGLSSLGVPYVVAFRDNNALFPPRNTVQEVRDLAYQDLTTAYNLMDAGLNDSKEYISTFAVKALEARIANYFGDFPKSLAAAQIVVNSQQFSVATSAGFLSTFSTDQAANSVFEIAFTATDNPGINGLANIYQNTNYGDVIALPNLAAIYEANDVRGVGGVITQQANGTFRNTGKYPSIAPYEDNVSVIRYEEVVLLYAEALLETGSAGPALTALNQIPSNRSATPYTVANKANILLERRKELAFEGFRFHDLARTGQDIPNPDGVLQLHGGPSYGDYNFALPIPSNEADVNANVEQNFGY
ncbi:RagB/SusD family nutrient uptake outer membrane protein [Leeuwenhoekiella sp. W20_SRS_FM14]|uniref:RagB/SusD family nutrient uptake outer membrane protein n=1 Tax=Leeuwenhoekiella sp. W20_SRS_FM14 TaxID=3240270 RepID=UPI003F9CC4A2